MRPPLCYLFSIYHVFQIIDFINTVFQEKTKIVNTYKRGVVFHCEKISGEGDRFSNRRKWLVWLTPTIVCHTVTRNISLFSSLSNMVPVACILAEIGGTVLSDACCISRERMERRSPMSCMLSLVRWGLCECVWATKEAIWV